MPLIHSRFSLHRDGLRVAVALLLALLCAHVSLAATIDVDSDCELPAAIIAANTDSNTHDTDCTAGSGADTISLANVGGSIQVQTAPAQITTEITLAGAGQSISGDAQTRIFHVASSGKLTIDNATLESGAVNESSFGGMIWNEGGTVTITNSTISSNEAGYGGAIASSGTLTISNSAIQTSEADASDGKGGGIYISGGSATITNSAITGNAAEYGGGIYLQSGSLTISNSTIAQGNSAKSSGGGAGMHIAGGTATITHTTIHGNTLTGSASSSGGTALVVDGTSASVSLRNSILSDADSSTQDCRLTSSATLAQTVGNLIESGNGNCTAPDSRNDANLDAIAGAPGYHKPSDTSEALGIGDAAICRQYPQDRLGYSRPPTGCDAGAVERDGYNYIDVQSTCSLANAISSAENDNVSGGCNSGVSDNAAIDYIRLNADVSYSAAIAGIHSALPHISSVMILDGGGYTISKASGGDFRLFDIYSGGDFTLRDATVRGFTQTTGGAVYNRDTLTLEDCLFEGNIDKSSGGSGGGALHLDSGQTSTTINRCAFKENDSENGPGGAIESRGGSLTVSNSTFIGNTCASDGCAINIGGGTVELSHNTYWNNATDGTGNISGVNGGGGTVDMLNSIIGRDSRLGGQLCGGSFNNYNAERGIIMWNGPTQNDPCGKVTVANPNLGAETGSVPYLPLRAGSPAIGAGAGPAASTCARYPTDQRGASRPASGCDLGAVQYFAVEESEIIAGGPNIPPTPVSCTGYVLNQATDLRLSASFGICNGIQFQRLEARGIGIQGIVEGGFLDAVDVWGWVRPTVEVCFPQAGKTLFLNAASSPRTVAPLASFRDGFFTCARVTTAGTIVLMSPDSPHGSSPADSPPGPLAMPAAQSPAAQPAPEPTAIASTPLSNCMVRTQAILNLRTSPNGTIVGLVPWDAWLTAFARSPGWYYIDYHGERGWISAGHVEPRGSCG